MQLFVRGSPTLEPWDARPFWPATLRGPSPGDHRDAYEREVAREAAGEPAHDGPHRRVAAAILRYEVFPARWVQGLVRRTPVEVGDTVGIRFRHLRGIELFFAARVTDRFDAPRGDVWATGFTYRTLVGHPELGEETFSVEKHLATGRITAALRSWSRPGTALATLAAPLVRYYQLHASRAALDHLARIAAATR